MKTIVLLLFACCFFVGQAFTQQVEVLYFKANLGCCQARACSNLESNVKGVIEDNFDADQVVFKTVWLNNEDNAEIVNKLNARSQSVFIVNSDEIVDISDIVRDFRRTRNTEDFETGIIETVKKLL